MSGHGCEYDAVTLIDFFSKKGVQTPSLRRMFDAITREVLSEEALVVLTSGEKDADGVVWAWSI